MINLETLVLLRGAHEADNGVCLLEATARYAGEKHSDRPACACPIISAYGRVLNDRMPDDQRQRLVPFVALIANTKASREVEMRRMFLLVNRAARRFAPAALDSAGLRDSAAALRALEPIIDRRTAAAAGRWAAAEAAAAGRWAAAAAAAAAEAAAEAAEAAAEAAEAAAEAAAPVWDESITLLQELIDIKAA